MKKLVIVFVAVFCSSSLAFSQEERVDTTQELRYFKEDNAFYSGSLRLLDSEVRQTLSKNVSALEAWKKGEAFKKAHNDLQIATWVLTGVGGIVCILPLISLIDDRYFEILNPMFIYGMIASFCVIGGLSITIPITKAKYKSCYSEAVGIYNKGLYKTSASLHIGTTGNGFGFSLKF